MAQWIWKFGEFEIYHSELLHNRRTQYGYPEPPVWKIYAPDSAIRFSKTVTTRGGRFHVTARGDFAVSVGTDYASTRKYGGRADIELAPGTTNVSVIVSNTDSFPCLYIDGVIQTDDSWLADDLADAPTPVGTYARYHDAACPPDVFHFAYEPIAYIDKKAMDGGVLFDFGRETFAKTTITFGEGVTEADVRFGESREEALSAEWCVIRHHAVADDDGCHFPPQAFRYIFVSDARADVSAEYEYLPLPYRGAFHCGEDMIDRVWDMAAYTFHLNSREFFLDGIKRDRWVWSGDAYQSLFVNRYLFFDEEIEQRTLVALGGKLPVKAHLNTIVDYSYLWLISLHEHYLTYGNRRFLKQILPQARAIMAFCRERVSVDGFVRGGERDWVFIDWAPMDKEGALCGEQVLFARALSCFAALCRFAACDEPLAAECEKQAEALQRAVMEKFYDAEKHAFIDSYESGKRNVTRHCNILAYLFLPMSDEMKRDIYEHVMQNDEVRQITTPYFKFFENQTHCEAGNGELLERTIREYYGAMLATGATTLYEEFDPTKSGIEHYAMYGHPFEKSLCHAWSASPIYLLGCYRAGVRNTGIGYDTFEVRPDPGDLGAFSCTVPLPKGEVRVTVEAKQISVLATAEGGTLHYGGQSVTLTPGEETVVSR